MTQVIPGFSLANRWLLYTSAMLAPAQALSGVGSHCPSNLGFLAYNWYNQYIWYRAVKAKQLHALSLLPVHFNMIYALTYLGGVTSGNFVMGALLGLGTTALLIFNTVVAWMGWATIMPEGYHIYRFYFFGWRTLTDGWHIFFLVWQLIDSGFALNSIILSIFIAMAVPQVDDDKSVWKYPGILVGAPFMMLIIWPLVMWTELIVSRNHIESETDMIAVGLFIVQVVTMLVPSCSPRVPSEVQMWSLADGRKRLVDLVSFSSATRASNNIPLQSTA